MSGWSIPIDRLAAKMQADVELVARKVTLDLFTAVVRRTPVDTGRFRANWNVSYGAPNYSTTDSTNTARADAEARKAISLPVGGVVWLSNGLPYGPRLEVGWSKQAPAGMVRVSVAEFTSFVNNALR